MARLKPQASALLRRRDRHGSGQGRLARGHRPRGLDLGRRPRARDELPAGVDAGRHDEPLLPRPAGRNASRRRAAGRREADRCGRRRSPPIARCRCKSKAGPRAPISSRSRRRSGAEPVAARSDRRPLRPAQGAISTLHWPVRRLRLLEHLGRGFERDRVGHHQPRLDRALRPARRAPPRTRRG